MSGRRTLLNFGLVITVINTKICSEHNMKDRYDPTNEGPHQKMDICTYCFELYLTATFPPPGSFAVAQRKERRRLLYCWGRADSLQCFAYRIPVSRRSADRAVTGERKGRHSNGVLAGC